MKKLLFFALIGIITISCSKNDKIVGKWQMYETTIETDGEKRVFNAASPGEAFEVCSFGDWWEFQRDGTLIIFDYCESETITQNWGREGNVLTLLFFGIFPNDITIISLTKTELVLESTAGENRETARFKRL